MNPRLIGIDWGSSNFRAYLIDADAQILAKQEASCGMLTLQHPEQYATTLQQQIGPWLDQYPQLPVYMAGMVGARQGWVEARYLNCPLPLSQLSSALTKVAFDAERSLYIVPGVSLKTADDCDVMRGEETQLLGATAITEDSTIFCLPGTHSKWALVEHGVLQHFRTFMTGELFSILEKHSILTRQLTPLLDESAFDEGIKRATLERGLLSEIFKVRANVLLGTQDQAASYAYLSGLLIGYELKGAREYWESVGDSSITIIAASTLAQWYQRAVNQLGAGQARLIDPQQAIVSGLLLIQEGC